MLGGAKQSGADLADLVAGTVGDPVGVPVDGGFEGPPLLRGDVAGTDGNGAVRAQPVDFGPGMSNSDRPAWLRV